MDRRAFNSAAGVAAILALSSAANACSPAPMPRTDSIADVLAALHAGRFEQARAMLNPQVKLVIVDPLAPRFITGAERVAQELRLLVSQGYIAVGAPEGRLSYHGVSDSLGSWDRLFLWRRMESGELAFIDGCGEVMSDSYALLAGGSNALTAGGPEASTLALLRMPIPMEMMPFATSEEQADR